MRGRGPYSDIVVNFTQEGSEPVIIYHSNFECISVVPSHVSAPNIMDHRQTDGSIMMTWKLLTLEEARGFITGYTVTAQQADFGLVLRQTPTSVRVSPNDTMATISGLDPKHAYTITLSANTSQGGNSSSTLLQPVGEPMINLLLQ